MRACNMLMSVKRKLSAILLNFGQGQGSLIKLMLSNAGIDDAVDQIFNALRGRSLHGARGAFDCVRKADDRDFLGLRPRPGIAEAFFLALPECLPDASS